MDRICQYSTIIFAGNVSVLLIVAITTDYWEYRGFRKDHLLSKLANTNRTEMIFPTDTKSYFELRYTWGPKAPIHPYTASSSDDSLEVYYQPPAFLHKYYQPISYSVKVTVFNGTHNETIEKVVRRRKQSHEKLFLFTQYGNLFRECDNLEASVRRRMGLGALQSGRCFNFITNLRGGNDFISRELPAVIHLERAAFTFAVACIIASIISVVGGAYGSLMQEKVGMITASSAALISGVSLTVAIAIFHGKCHLLHRRKFMAGVEIPYTLTVEVEEARTHNYGWSFVLAWICVALCFIHTWVWLLKAQDTPNGRFLASSSQAKVKHYVYNYSEQATPNDKPTENHV